MDSDVIKQATHKVKAKGYQEVSNKEGTGINEVFQKVGALLLQGPSQVSCFNIQHHFRLN